ncbi:MAG: Excinuclease ABC subunit C [Parcubacteria group bacterium GW2011_GWA1_40_21]|nr:MAG: Excinuclease ABC subunit C [Parcubacteria group bacterium GW2011_GWA1_40_21]
MIPINQTKKLPDAAGVYLFKKGKEILYIGKATSLRDRVRSYFSADLANTRGQFIVDMVGKAEKIDYFKTDSVLEAIILESNLIKKYQPKYNTKEKDDKSYNYVIITKEDFPRVLLIRGRELEAKVGGVHELNIKYKFGPYPNGSAIKEGLKIIRKIFPFRDKCNPSKGSPWKPCFNRQIGLCPGVCSGEISKTDYADTIRNIKMFFEGKKKNLIKKLERQMKEFAKNREFEKAGKVKKTLFALNHIQDVALIKKSEEEIVENVFSRGAVFRMEAFDVAHISGTNTVGAMVVSENGELKKSDYRKFKIRGVKIPNDTATLKEILERRLKHKEWRLPDVIVYDGGIAHRNAVLEIFKKDLGENHGMKIIGVVKDERHKPKKIIGEAEIIKKHKKQILLLNSEAHRFAISFHRQLRNLNR